MTKAPLTRYINGVRVVIGSVEVREDGTVEAELDHRELGIEEVPSLREMLQPDLELLSVGYEQHTIIDINALQFEPLPQRTPGEFSTFFRKPTEETAGVPLKHFDAECGHQTSCWCLGCHKCRIDLWHTYRDVTQDHS